MNGAAGAEGQRLSSYVELEYDAAAAAILLCVCIIPKAEIAPDSALEVDRRQGFGVPEKSVRPREIFGWAMYDFANSGYTTVVITAVFNAYFVSVVAGNAAWATFAWTAALSVSYAAIMVTAPFLGAWADAHAAKKRVLALTTAGCIVFTAGLALAGQIGRAHV